MQAGQGSPAATDDVLLTTAEAAEYCGVSTTTIHNWVYAGKLFRVKAGGHNRFWRSALDAATQREKGDSQQ